MKIAKKNNKKDCNSIKINFLANITEDCFIRYSFDNTFCLFKSINDVLYLTYTNNIKSIISYNLLNCLKINEIKNAHETVITSFRHYFDKLSKIDLIMSISAEDNTIKIWNAYNFICLLYLKKINKNGTLLSGCFLNDNNKLYIISSNRQWETAELIKVYDLKGNKIREINNENKNIFFIDNYYDEKLSKNYIITGNEGCSYSIDYNKNQFYHKYDNYNGKLSVRSLIINDKNDIIKLIESNDDGIIRIWNFHSGECINKINICESYLCGLYLLDDNYLFVGCYDKIIRLLDIEKETIVDISGHEHSAITVKSFNHPNYGKCLISQGLNEDQIKLWIINN